MLKDGDLNDRLKAAEWLGETGDTAGVLPLIDALLDESTVVRYAAAKSLGLLADHRAIEPLTLLLRSDNHWLRRAAARALGLIGARTPWTCSFRSFPMPIMMSGRLRHGRSGNSATQEPSARSVRS